jgi:hypothetical protein
LIPDWLWERTIIFKTIPTHFDCDLSFLSKHPQIQDITIPTCKGMEDIQVSCVRLLTISNRNKSLKWLKNNKLLNELHGWGHTSISKLQCTYLHLSFAPNKKQRDEIEKQVGEKVVYSPTRILFGKQHIELQHLK